MSKVTRPRRGSLAFHPRKRASRIVPRINTWPPEQKLRIQGFACYKAGMTHAVIVDDREGSPTYGEEIVVPCTVLEAPPMVLFGIRAYVKTAYGLKTFTEVWAPNLSKDLRRKLQIPKKNSFKEKMKMIEENLDKIYDLRALLHTQPRLVGALGKKKPEIIESGVGGKDLKEKLEFLKSKLGKEIRISEVYEPGEWVDVKAVTKGKGFQGPVKRFGVALMYRKASKHRRHVGCIGSVTPRTTSWRVPMPGQMGFHTRTEYNKRVLLIGEKGQEITPRGGFVKYGVVRNDFIVLHGSVPGPRKRLIRLRPAIRPPKWRKEPKVKYISLSSKQGA